MLFGVDTLGKTAQQYRRDVQKAYRRLVLLHHPDKGGDPQTFLDIQNLYDNFKKQPLREDWANRSIHSLFFAFRDFVCSKIRFSPRDLKNIANTSFEVDWMLHFLDVAIGAGFIADSARGDFLLTFMDANITIPRFYRAYSLKCVSKGDPLFWSIQHMFIEQLPWDYAGLKESISYRS